MHDTKVSYNPAPITPQKVTTSSAKDKPAHDGGVADFLKGTGPAKRKLPSVKVGDLGVSIKREQNRQAIGETLVANAATKQEAKNSSTFNESDLNFQWQSYANRML